MFPFLSDMPCGHLKSQNRKLQLSYMSAQEFRHKLKEPISKEIFFAGLADCVQTAKIMISSWSSWQLWAGIRVMQHKSCKVLSI